MTNDPMWENSNKYRSRPDPCAVVGCTAAAVMNLETEWVEVGYEYNHHHEVTVALCSDHAPLAWHKRGTP